MTEEVQGWMDTLEVFLLTFGVNLFTAVLILVVGKWVAGLIKKYAVKLMSKRNVDATLQGFLGNILYALMLVFVVVAALGQLGIETASFIAIIGAAGLAIGLALQGSLSNFAAGVLMLIFRPIKVGDFVEAGGCSGTVEEVHIFTTQMRTGDNKTVIVPNAQIMGDAIVNYSTKPTRRVDFVVGVGYGADLAKVKTVLADEIAKQELVLQDNGHTIGVSELADSSVNFVVRMWVNSADYWTVYYAYNEAVKNRLDAENIDIPYPQRVVHMVNSAD